jgi:thiamine-phosphate pyrophosphorylase
MSGTADISQARAKLARQAARLNARGGRRLPSLILMTDDSRDADWAEAVRGLPRGAAVIVRHRNAGAREALARQLKPLCTARGVKMLVAEDVRLAVRVRADGVHVPERHAARLRGVRRAHPRWLITSSAHGAAAIAAAQSADAVLISPVFATASHPAQQALGAVRFAALAAGARAAYALGGIDGDSAQRLAALRLAGVALIGGWLRS